MLPRDRLALTIIARFVTLVTFAACTSNDDATPTSSSVAAGPTVSPVPATSSPSANTSSIPEFAPREFCVAAEFAAEGNLAFSDPAATGELTEFQGLTEHQRQVISEAIDTTRREIERAAGGSWTNNEMVDAVNQLCGSDLTDVTLTP